MKKKASLFDDAEEDEPMSDPTKQRSTFATSLPTKTTTTNVTLPADIYDYDGVYDTIQAERDQKLNSNKLSQSISDEPPVS